MTGEMSYINPETGIDSNGEEWPIHLAIADKLGGELKPFDSYQGPYVAINGDITVGNSPYTIPIQHLGIIRLWVCYEDELTSCVYREDNEKSISFDTFMNEENNAVLAALELMDNKS